MRMRRFEMGYATYLKDLLRPLRLYDLDAGDGAVELECEGEQLDAVFAALETAQRESIVASAEDVGLSAYEKILPFVPAYATDKDRRRAIEALLRIDSRSFTLAAINDTVAGCGIRALVEETDIPLTVRVSFPYNRGVPEDFEQLQKRIEEILPCHLEILYEFLFVLWQELEEWLETWQEVEECGAWSAVESWFEGE